MNEIFVSYASADRARVEPLMRALEAEGLQLWWDRDIDYGQNFHKVIEQALAKAPCVIVIWSRESIESEWVLNEASDARRRDRLVPVLIDPVSPPLEFRHLQAADLSNWKGDAADPQFIGLHKGLVAMIGESDATRPAAQLVPPSRSWWQTWPGRALGAGGLLLGLSVLVLALNQVGALGWLKPPRAVVAPVQSSAVAAGANGSGVTSPSLSAQATVPSTAGSGTTAGSATERINLLDTDDGAQLLAANEEDWKGLFHGKPTFTTINADGFAVLAIRGDKPVTIDTLGVYVESTSGYNSKDMAIYTSVASAEGPFAKAAQVTVPNYRNMMMTFHQLHFAPVQARFVKLQLLSFQDGERPNGYQGSIQLYAAK